MHAVTGSTDAHHENAVERVDQAHPGGEERREDHHRPPDPRLLFRLLLLLLLAHGGHSEQRHLRRCVEAEPEEEPDGVHVPLVAHGAEAPPAAAAQHAAHARTTAIR